MLTTNGKVLEYGELVYYIEERYLHKVKYGLYNMDNYNEYVKNKNNVIIFKSLEELQDYANTYFSNKKN